jgi:microcystin-dependent protein
MAIYIVISTVGKDHQRSGTEFQANAWKAIDTTSYGDSGAAILADPHLDCRLVVSDQDAVLSDAKVVINASIIHASTLVSAEVPVGDIDGMNTAYTVAHAPLPATSIEVYQSTDSGATWTLLTLTTHYTLASAALTMVTAPANGSLLFVRYRY